MIYFLEDHRMENYADDSTSCSAKTHHKLVIENLPRLSLNGFKLTT